MIRTKSYISFFILAFAFGSIGCNPGIIDVPPPPVTDASAYFFPKNTGTITFNKFDSVTKASSSISLLFSSPDSGFTIVENNGTPFDTLSGTIGPDAVSISGLSTHSIIPLPSGFSIKPKSSPLTGKIPLPFHHIIAVSGSVIASNNDSGIYFSTNSGSSWSRASTSFVKSTDPVTIFAAMGDRVYAGTASGNLIASGAKVNSWSTVAQFNGNSILAIATDPGNSILYVSLNNDSTYEVTVSSSRVRILPTRIPALHFTSLAYLSFVDTITGGMNVLVGGTDKGLYYRQFSRPATDTDWTQITKISLGKIRSLIATNAINGFYCSAGNSIDSSPDGIQWTVAGKDTGMLAYDAMTGTVVSWMNRGIFGFVAGNSTAQIPPINNIRVNDFSASGGYYFAATDSGVYSTVNPAQKWTASSAGLTVTRTQGTEIPGSLILLRSITGSASSDSSWEACTMVRYQSTISVPITGRIIGHLDSLSAGGKTYTDVIAVRYAYESLPNNTSQIPYWVIYYAKNEGPVVISQIYGTATLSKAIRQR